MTNSNPHHSPTPHNTHTYLNPPRALCVESRLDPPAHTLRHSLIAISSNHSILSFAFTLALSLDPHLRPQYFLSLAYINTTSNSTSQPSAPHTRIAFGVASYHSSDNRLSLVLVAHALSQYTFLICLPLTTNSFSQSGAAQTLSCGHTISHLLPTPYHTFPPLAHLTTSPIQFVTDRNAPFGNTPCTHLPARETLYKPPLQPVTFCLRQTQTPRSCLRQPPLPAPPATLRPSTSALRQSPPTLSPPSYSLRS